MSTIIRERVELHSIADRVEIAPDVFMPRLGLGTSHSYAQKVRREIAAGLRIGYRSIDTAPNYDNERDIGAELALGHVLREDLFVTTKLDEPDQGYSSTFRAIDGSLSRLGLDYLDLYLIHWPVRELTNETWRAMEELLDQGKTRAIGVCNFQRADLDQLFETATVPPAVNQFEFHPLRQRRGLVEECWRREIAVEAWGPVRHADVIGELAEIGRRHGKTPAQVSLRWILQQGIVTIPKSVHEARLRENADIFDFELSAQEMAAIDAIDRG